MSAAETLQPLLRAALGGEPTIRLRCWDGSEVGPADAPVQLTIKHRRALRRLLWAPNELGFARAALQLRVIGPPPRPPVEEAKLSGRRHSVRRDADAIAHHYDVGNDFYAILLGPSMTYSCAYWADPDYTLEDAQLAKVDLVARKLGLARS